MISPRLRRILLLSTFGLVALLSIFSFLSFARRQSIFQQHLKSTYITWGDFPDDYAEALRKSHEDSGPLDTFNYTDLRDAAEPWHIPPTIHFIWFKHLYDSNPEITNLSTQGSDAPQTCRDHNPTFNVTVWSSTTARELLEEHYSWFIPTYESYRHSIQRVDAFKYFVLWHYGGIYMDMDIACRRPLDPLLPFPGWFPEASPLGVNNDLMAVRKEHPIMKKMMESLKRRNWNLIFPYLTIFWSTGPQFTSDMLKEAVLDTVSDEGEEEGLLSWRVLPQVFYSEEYTYFGHMPGGTWHEGDVAVVLWLVNHRKPVLFLLAGVFASAVIFVILRWRKFSFKRPFPKPTYDPVPTSELSETPV